MRKNIVSIVVVIIMVTFGESMAKEVTAHRGASGYLPEHTLESKTMAHAMGVNYIEQDLVMTKDNVLIVLHDPTLDTTTDVAKKFPARARKDGKYYVIDFTWPEIQTLCVKERVNRKTGIQVYPKRFPNSSNACATGMKVHTFEEELVTIQGMNRSRGRNIGIYPEIKEPAFHEKEGKNIVKATVAMLTKYGYTSKESSVILQTFDYDSLKSIRDAGYKGRLYILIAGRGQDLINDEEVHKWLRTDEGIRASGQYADGIAPSIVHLYRIEDGKIVKTDLADRIKKAGMKVDTWTHRVDDLPNGFVSSDEMLTFVFEEVGVDGLFSDHPDVVIDFLSKKSDRNKKVVKGVDKHKK
ncbi:MAG: glycerophosphodiester phosphodiesterase [Desulfovibrionaceae bacterium]